MILTTGLLAIAAALFVSALVQIHRTCRAARFWYQAQQVFAHAPAAKYACPMTAEEIAAMHATRWDGD